MRLIKQIGIQYCHGSHGLYYGHGSGQDAGVVASLDLKDCVVAVHVDGGLFSELCSHGFEEHTEVDVLSVGYASLYASGVVGEGVDFAVSHAEDVVLLGASLPYSVEAFAIFEALDGIDAEHGGSEVGMEFGEGRFAEPWGTALDDACDDASDGVALALDLPDELLHACGSLWVGTAYGVVFDAGEVELAVVSLYGYVAHL